MRNLNLLFNKTYYDALTAGSFPEDAVKDCNAAIYGAEFRHDRDYMKPGAMVRQQFLLQTAYPGLLVGTGYSHNAGLSNEEVAVGFSFDYVTGQPYIPGSTVKGMLRSHFKDHPQAVMALTGQEEAWVKALEQEIFDNNDVFFDAVVYDSDRYGLLMGSEFITPHSSPTENPVPIKMIKVLPGVRFEFRFALHDSEKMTGQQKLALFQDLLELFGIGTKTNVGYGILIPDETNGTITPKEVRSSEPTRDTRKPQPFRTEPRNSGFDRPAQTPGKPGSDCIVCPACGWRNYRTNKNTGRENWNWREGTCYKCKEKIR